ncbi:hypothetical protein Tco_0691233 [Tanacetum coccineum]
MKQLLDVVPSPAHKSVNTTRGSSFTEICFHDLPLDFSPDKDNIHEPKNSKVEDQQDVDGSKIIREVLPVEIGAMLYFQKIAVPFHEKQDTISKGEVDGGGVFGKGGCESICSMCVVNGGRGVPLVDGVFKGALGALEALEMEDLVDAIVVYSG